MDTGHPAARGGDGADASARRHGGRVCTAPDHWTPDSAKEGTPMPAEGGDIVGHHPAERLVRGEL